MATPQYSLLGLYAAFDQLVMSRPETAPLVEQFLPGTTAPGQREWSKQIQAMVSRLSRDPSTAVLPTVDEAVAALAEPRSGFAPRVQEPSALTIGQRARLTYALGALINLPVPMTDATRGVLTDQALSWAAHGGHDDSPDERQSRGAQLRAVFSEHFRSRADYRQALQRAEGVVSEELKAIGPPCGGWVEHCGEELCAVLRSDICTSDITVEDVKNLTVEDVKKVAEPLNWAKCCPFFCEMEPLHPLEDDNGCTRLLEHVSTDCVQYHMKTALKFWKGEIGPGAYINYEFDDNREGTGDSFFVVVDNGTVCITPADDGGVRVRSTKHVKIEGLSVTATAMWSCLNGWSDVGEQMLFHCAKSPPEDMKPWHSSGHRFEAKALPSAAVPRGLRTELVEQSVKMLTGCIEDASKTSSEFVGRWLAGQLELKDYAKFSADIAGGLASEPWRFLAKAAGSVGRSAGLRPPPPDQQRGGDS